MAISLVSYSDAGNITISDTADNYWGALIIGSAGTLAVVTAAGSTVTFEITTIDTLIPLQVQKVLNTGTTCTNIVGLR